MHTPGGLPLAFLAEFSLVVPLSSTEPAQHLKFDDIGLCNAAILPCLNWAFNIHRKLSPALCSHYDFHSPNVGKETANSVQSS